MKEPYWVSLESCLALHDLMISAHGGAADVRDLGRLQLGLARPQQLYSYGAPTLEKLAAAYATLIIQGHPFTDGNKRTGFILAAAFLELNGLEFIAPEVEVVIQTVALAAGEISEPDYAVWLGRNCRPREKIVKPRKSTRQSKKRRK